MTPPPEQALPLSHPITCVTCFWNLQSHEHCLCAVPSNHRGHPECPWRVDMLADDTVCLHPGAHHGVALLTTHQWTITWHTAGSGFGWFLTELTCFVLPCRGSVLHTMHLTDGEDVSSRSKSTPRTAALQNKSREGLNPKCGAVCEAPCVWSTVRQPPAPPPTQMEPEEKWNPHSPGVALFPGEQERGGAASPVELVFLSLFYLLLFIQLRRASGSSSTHTCSTHVAPCTLRGAGDTTINTLWHTHCAHCSIPAAAPGRQAPLPVWTFNINVLSPFLMEIYIQEIFENKYI